MIFILVISISLCIGYFCSNRKVPITKYIIIPLSILALVWFVTSIYQYGILVSSPYIVFQYVMAIVSGSALGVSINLFLNSTELSYRAIKLISLFLLSTLAFLFIFFNILLEFKIRNLPGIEMSVFAFKYFNEEAINPLDSYTAFAYKFKFPHFEDMQECNVSEKSNLFSIPPLSGLTNLRSIIENLTSEKVCVWEELGVGYKKTLVTHEEGLIYIEFN